MAIIDWATQMKATKKALEDLKSGDRLKTISNIFNCIGALKISLTGWFEWITNPEVMSNFTPEELEEIFKFFQTQCFIILAEDIKWTERKSKDFAKEPKEDSAKKKPLKYVS